MHFILGLCTTVAIADTVFRSLVEVISLQHAQQAAHHLSEIKHGRDLHGIVRYARVHVPGAVNSQ